MHVLHITTILLVLFSPSQKITAGCWQLAGGHGDIDHAKFAADMAAHVEAGITTFDTADIYGACTVYVLFLSLPTILPFLPFSSFFLLLGFRADHESPSHTLRPAYLPGPSEGVVGKFFQSSSADSNVVVTTKVLPWSSRNGSGRRTKSD